MIMMIMMIMLIMMVMSMMMINYDSYYCIIITYYYCNNIIF